VGASPEASELKVVEAGAAVSPGAPWLAFGVAPSGVDVAGLKDGHLLIGGKPQPLLDVSGLDRAAVVQVGSSGGQLGVALQRPRCAGTAVRRPIPFAAGRSRRARRQ
jgi:hypothetical protein